MCTRRWLDACGHCTVGAACMQWRNRGSSVGACRRGEAKPGSGTLSETTPDCASSFWLAGSRRMSTSSSAPMLVALLSSACAHADPQCKPS